MPIDPRTRMFSAIQSGDAADVVQALKEVDTDTKSKLGARWMHDAVTTPHIPVIDALIDAGIDINIDSRGSTEPIPPLCHAIGSGNVEVVRHLISRGANVNLGRNLIGAINVGTNMYVSSLHRKAWALEFVKILVEAGTDVNRWWYFGDPKKKLIVNALSWALANGREDIADYLRAHGAVMPPKDVGHGDSLWARVRRLVFNAIGSKKSLGGIEQEVISYFEKHFGPVHPLSVGEIVPGGLPIRVHVIPASKDRKLITLFTTGMSSDSLTAPDGYKEYESVELFIQLPEDWPEGDLGKIQFSWPVHWLRMVAQHPHEEDSWLFPVSIFDEKPGELITPEAKFTAMLVMAERKFTSKEGFPVHLYRLTPIYPEERELEKREGVDALMRAFDEGKIPFVVDFNRPNVATASSAS